ncbi:MAG: hypothetical protein RMI79_02640 [Nitrososphaerota archaeon]|nr:hypothetical protein [Nitrososphaerota archaeon]
MNDNYSSVLQYYSNTKVIEELFNYGRGRWIAVEGFSDKRVFVRYDKNGEPLKLRNSNDVKRILKSFWFAKPRSFYGSINKYEKLSKKEDLDNILNIKCTTPTWDVDNEVDKWHDTIEICKLIINELEKEGVTKSVYLKWSGRGCHIHLSEEAFSDDFLKKYHPLDLAFAVVEYIIRKVKRRLVNTSAKVENKIDLKRVFTLPLSLHRYLDYACICFKPEDIDRFDLSWADPKNFRHEPVYTAFEKGEADELAEKALSETGGYFKKMGLASFHKEKEERKTPELGRFQVMALLQAARCFILTGDIEKSKSFGLNRAIFYAWAKHRGIGTKSSSKRTPPIFDKSVEEKRKIFYLGNEAAYLSDDGWLIIGNIKQTPGDYDSQIVRRINEVVPYEEAWRRTLEYLKKFPQEVLLDQQKFFNQVYKPVRDSFIETVYKRDH